MRISTSQYNSGSLSPYQEDKEQVLANMEAIKKAIIKNDFDGAQELLSKTETLFDKKTNKRLGEQQTKIKEDLQNLSNALEKKDSKVAKESADKVQEEIKSNKSLVLKTHGAMDIKSSLTAGFLSVLYA